MLKRLSRTTNRAFAAGCAAFALVVMSAQAVVWADDLKDRQRDVEKKIEGAKGDYDVSSKAYAKAAAILEQAQGKLNAAQAELNAAQAELGEAKAQAAAIQVRLQQAKKDVAAAQVRVKKAKAKADEQRSALGRVAADNYQYGDPSLLRLKAVLTNQDPETIITQDDAMRSVMDRQTAVFEKMKASQRRMQAEKQKMVAAQARVEAERVAAAKTVKRRAELTDVAAQRRTKVAGLVSDKRSAEQKAKQEREADLEQLRALERENQQIKNQILAQASQVRRSYNGDAGGFLYPPTTGLITSPFGYRTHPIYGYYGLHDGIDFSAACGSALKAAGNGTVTQAYYSSAWGNRLFINLGTVNGKNITVIYNHLSGYAASVGSKVARGQVVAYAGNTGWSTGCHLHFTVMENGVPVNPLNYM